MKKTFLAVAFIICLSVLFAQKQSIVIQKNTLPYVNHAFSFTTTGPAGSAFVANPTISLNNAYAGKQALEVGASSSGKGYLAFTQNDANPTINEVYTYSSGAASWTDATFTALRLDYKSNGYLWFVGTDNNLYSTEFAGNQYTGVRDVGIGPDDSLYIIGNTGSGYQVRRRNSDGSYTNLGGIGAKRLDGGPGGTVWYIGSDNHVYFYNGTTTDMGLAPGNEAFIDISVGANGTAWAIGANPSNTIYNILYFWNGSAWIADALAPTGTTMYNVTVGADNEPLMTLNFNGGRTYLLKRLSDGRWIEIQAQTSGINSTQIFYGQPTGSYSFTEPATSGYYLQDIIIFGSTGDGYSTTTGTTHLQLDTNEHVYLQYTNVAGTKPAAQVISTACGGTFVETFGTGANNTFDSLPTGQTTYTYNSNPSGHYKGNGVNDGQYALVNSVYDATGYYYQWISGPGVNGQNCSYTCDIHGDATYGLSKVASDTDHTPGDVGGRMLLVNADFSSGVYYEKEYAGLAPGNSYQFSAWVANIILGSDTSATNPNVILRVVDPTTGSILLDLPTGDIPKTGTTLTWLEEKGSFNAPLSGNVKVYLINNKPGGQGNDLVLDDISLTATCQTISGTLFNDANGMTDGLVNGTGTNIGNTVYAILVDSNNLVVKSMLLPSSGAYSFSNLFSGTYSVKLSTTAPGAVGTVAPNASLPSIWINTGDSLGFGNGIGTGNITSGNLDSIRILATITNVTCVNFGVDRLPKSDSYTTSIPKPFTNTLITLNYSSNPSLPSLTGTDPEDQPAGGTLNGKSINITSLPSTGELWYNGIQITVGADGSNPPSANNPFKISSYDTTLLQAKTTGVNYSSISFKYAYVDAAGLADPTPATYTIFWAGLLPITLYDFSGFLYNSQVELKWQTSSENNSSYFEVQRSNDDIHFSDLKSIVANGFSNVLSQYQFTDLFPNPGYNYYRLKMVDRNGNSSYSQIIALKVDLSNLSNIVISPNPFVNFINVNIALRNASILNVNILDAQGKSVYKQSIVGNTGINLIQINDVARLSSGIYFLSISSNEGIVQQKIVKLRN